jgi:hypothetical protein
VGMLEHHHSKERTSPQNGRMDRAYGD